MPASQNTAQPAAETQELSIDPTMTTDLFVSVDSPRGEGGSGSLEPPTRGVYASPYSSIQDVPRFACPVLGFNSCNEPFYTCEQVKQHLADAHDCQYGCFYDNCKSAYPFPDTLKVHYANVHYRRYRCQFDDCSAAMLLPHDLKDHYAIDHDLRHECPEEMCEEAFADGASAKEHLKLAHGCMYPCPKPSCAAAFASRNRCARHYRLLHADVETLCPHAPECAWRNDNEHDFMALYDHVATAHDFIWSRKDLNGEDVGSD